jgi:hypothetical protein
MDRTQPYVIDAVAPVHPTRNRVAVYVGLAVLLTSACLLAVSGRGGSRSKFPRVVVPGSSGVCTSPPNGSLYSNAVDGAQMTVCISHQGNINQIQYPDTATGHTQVGFDGHCVQDTNTIYTDSSPGGPPSAGFGAATLTQIASNQWSMTRNTQPPPQIGTVAPITFGSRRAMARMAHTKPGICGS